MTSTQQLDIKVIYSGSGRRPAPVRRPSGSRPAPRAIVGNRARGWMLLGGVNLAVACGLYYGTWWHADPFLYMTFIMHTPLSGVDAEQVSTLLIPGLSDGPGPTRPQPVTPEGGTFHGLSGNATATTIGVTGYGWLGLSTVAYNVLALAAGAAWGTAGAWRWHRKWIILVTGTIIGLAVAAYLEWSRYGRAYPPNDLRMGMAGLIVLSLLLGLFVHHTARSWMRLAGLTVIVAAAGSAVGLYLLHRCGAIEPRYSMGQFAALLVIVFAVHSIYGWLLLLPISSRVGRS